MKTVLSVFFIIIFSLNLVSISYADNGCNYELISEKYDDITSLKKSKDWENINATINNDLTEIYKKTGVGMDKYEDSWYFTSSPDGKSSAFIAQKDGKTILVKDGVEMNEYEGYGSPLYSPDGKSFAFSAKKKDGTIVVVKDGIESNKYIDLQKIGSSGTYLKYSLDGNSFVFKAKGVKEGQDYISIFLVKDGIEIANYDAIEGFQYSPDGKSFIFFAFKDGKAGEDDKYILVVNGIENDKYDDIDKFQYSSELNNFIAAVEENGKNFIVSIDCKLEDNNSEIKNIDIKTGKTQSQLFKQMILSKKNLEKDLKFKKYITQIDLITEKLTNEKLEKIVEKIEKLPIKGRNHIKFKDFLDYLESKILLKLNNF